MSGKATGTQPAAKKTAAKKVAAKAPEKPAARTVAKKATARRTPPKAKVEPNLTAQLGTTVEIELPVDATSVVVERPDGSETTVFAAGGRALYVLDQLGVHVAGGLVVASVEETQA